jgi:cytochrome c oxidase assembly factor CtaG
MAMQSVYVSAHEGAPVRPHDAWSAWTWEPWVVVLLTVSAALYVRGVARLWSTAGRGRGIREGEAAAFVIGWMSLAVALVSPLHALGSALLAAHMVQHEVLMLVAAPLIVLGRPYAASQWALSLRGRHAMRQMTHHRHVQETWRLVSAPFAVWLLHAVVLWVWHVPSLYQRTLDNEMIHAAQHTMFFGTALLFWWTLIHGRYGRFGYGAAVVYVFATAMHSGALGALLTFSERLWYPVYAPRTAAWQLTPLDDQQLAGLIMWIPASLVFIVVGLALFAAWLKEAERRAFRPEEHTGASRV